MLKLKLQYFGHLVWRANSLEKILMLGKTEGRRRGQQRMRWLDSIIDSMNMNLSKLQEMMEDRGAWHAAVYGVTKRQTRLSNWTTTVPYSACLQQAGTDGAPFLALSQAVLTGFLHIHKLHESRNLAFLIADSPESRVVSGLWKMFSDCWLNQ